LFFCVPCGLACLLLSFLELILGLLCLLLLLLQLLLGCLLLVGKLLSQLLLLLPDFEQVVGHVSFPLDDRVILIGIDSADLAQWHVTLRGWHLAFSLLLGIQCLLGRLFKLSKVHLRAVRVLLENALIGLLPLGQDVVEAFIGLCLSTVNQVPDL